MPRLPFWAEVWNKLRPHAVSTAIEIGVYLRYWIMVLVAHGVKLVMSNVGIEAWLVSSVGWMENIVFLASFVSLFVRLSIRLYSEIRRGAL
jgi:hypothetical protein